MCSPNNAFTKTCLHKKTYVFTTKKHVFTREQLFLQNKKKLFVQDGQNYQKFTETPKNGQNGPKWSNRV